MNKIEEASDNRPIKSCWPYVSTSIILSLMTIWLFSIYSIVHWGIWIPSGHISTSIEYLKIDNEAHENFTDDKGLPGKSCDRMEYMVFSANKIKEASSKLIGSLEKYRLLGFLSTIILCMSFWRKPRWGGLIALPFVLIALLLSIVVQ